MNGTNGPNAVASPVITWTATACFARGNSSEESAMDWPTAAVLIAVVIAIMAVATTYLAGRSSK